jgi:uncharacterized protein (TIGR03083 family)
MRWTSTARREALAETCLSLADLADALTADEWALPTGCPGWNVFDQVAHVSSLESMLAGIAPLPHTAPPAPYIRNSIGTAMENLVDARRGWSTEHLIAELRAVTALRSDQLAALDDDPAATVPGPTGKPMPIALGVMLRVFDCLAHQTDVRRAVGRPGGLGGVAGALVASQIPQLLQGSWSQDSAATVQLAVDGTTTVLVVGDGGPQVSLSCTLADLVALSTGRSDVDPSVVAIAGDVELGRRLVAAMALTP